ncbi:hypothetical protein OKZ62_001867 [Vibrio navarrensis]|nr:hypothetical protein [Vibrio navarrensis]
MEQVFISTGLIIFAALISFFGMKVKPSKALYLSMIIGLSSAAVWAYIDKDAGSLVRTTAAMIVTYLVSYLLINSKRRQAGEGSE